MTKSLEEILADLPIIQKIKINKVEVTDSMIDSITLQVSKELNYKVTDEAKIKLKRIILDEIKNLNEKESQKYYYEYDDLTTRLINFMGGSHHSLQHQKIIKILEEIIGKIGLFD